MTKVIPPATINIKKAIKTFPASLKASFTYGIPSQIIINKEIDPGIVTIHSKAYHQLKQTPKNSGPKIPKTTKKSEITINKIALQ